LALDFGGAALGWRASTSLEDGLRLAYQAYLSESKQAAEWLSVIASAAKQSIVPRKERMDCFVATLLAMTAEIAGTVAARHAQQ